MQTFLLTFALFTIAVLLMTAVVLISGRGLNGFMRIRRVDASHAPVIDPRFQIRPPAPLCPQMTQITQIKTRTLRDVICVNLRDLREKTGRIKQQSSYERAGLPFRRILHPAS